MNKVIYFDNNDQRMDHCVGHTCFDFLVDHQIDRCVGQVYFDFLDYAFEEANYFMLVYVNYYGMGYSRAMQNFKKALKPYQVKSRSNPSWPGVLNTCCPNTTYKIVFYRTEPQAKEILKQVTKLSDWSHPSHPQDLAFFKGNQCWFYSVGHEKLAGIIHATEKDLDFLESRGLALRKDAEPENPYFEAYDEILEKS